MKHCALILILAIIPPFLFAQRHTISTDLVSLAQGNAWVSWGWRVQPRACLEVSVGYERFADKPDWLFHGDQIAHYLQRRRDSFNHVGILLRSTGWINVESEPLPEAPAFFALDGIYLRAGWQFFFENRQKKWRIILQPNIGVSSLYLYEVTGDKRLTNYLEESWTHGNYPYIATVKQQSAAYTQTRFMRPKTRWIFGFNYDVALRRIFGKHFFLEARGSLGMNFSSPYNTPKPPVRLRSVWFRPLLMTGVIF
jgi:hypothetical protein